MHITLTNNLAYVEDYAEEEMAWLRRYLSTQQPAFKMDYKAGRAKYAGMEVLSFMRSDNSFPAGFLPAVVNSGRKLGYPVEVGDARANPKFDLVAVDTSFLRDYQHEAVEACLKRKRGLIKLPTGGGKTVLATALVMRVPCAWLFLVQAKDLLHQTAKQYQHRTGLQPGIIGDGQRTPPDEGANLTIATVQSLMAASNLDDFLTHVDGLIVDEAHTAAAASLQRLIMGSENAQYRIGMSGTPLARGDHKSMLTIGALGPIIYTIDPERLIQAGWLSRPTIIMVEMEQFSERKTYAGAYSDLVVKSKNRNKLVVELMKKAARPNLTFVKTIDHGRVLAAMAKQAGLSVEFVWGNKSTKAREAAIKRLVRGDIDCIISSKVFFVGVDIPELLSVINAVGGKSVIEALQRIGRGMRVVEGKTTFEVWDVFDKGQRNMEAHASARRKAYESEGHTVEVWEEGTHGLG